MVIGPRSVQTCTLVCNGCIKIDGQYWTKVGEAKFFGTTIDNALTFKQHYENVLTRLSIVSGKLHKIHRYVQFNFLRMVYMSLGYSIFTYGIIILGRSSLTCTSKLQKSQNNLIELIYGSSDIFVYKCNVLLTFNQAFDYFAAIKFYKELNNPVNMYFNNKILNYQRPYSRLTRFSQNRIIVPPLFTKSKCQTSFIYQSIKFWNSLPLDIKNSANINTCKRNVKIFLLNQHL